MDPSSFEERNRTEEVSTNKGRLIFRRGTDKFDGNQFRYATPNPMLSTVEIKEN